MTVTRMPVGLPWPNPTKSYWQTPPLPIANHRTTPELPESVEYVIVGSGIVGAVTAYKLLQEEPSASILMLEARQACSGATGRNGGHCRAGRYLNFKEDLERFGQEDALRLEVLEEENVKKVAEFISSHEINCDLRTVETVDTTTYDDDWQEMLDALKTRKEVFKGRLEAEVLTKHKVWTQEEARQGLLMPEVLGAISFPAYVLSPYKFICALLEMCLEKGLNLQTTTLVSEVSRSKNHRSINSSWKVYTERGAVSAPKVILATNAYTGALYPPLANFLIPTRGQVLAVRPGAKIAGNPALKRSVGMSNNKSGDYMQSRAEQFSGAGDCIIGGGRRLGTDGEYRQLDDSKIHPDISSYLRGAAASYFGRENWGDDGEVVQEWTGIMGYTEDKQPIIGEAPGQKGLWVCAGFNGHGMALTFQSAEALVQLMMGRENEVNKWLPQCYKLSRIVR